MALAEGRETVGDYHLLWFVDVWYFEHTVKTRPFDELGVEPVIHSRLGNRHSI